MLRSFLHPTRLQRMELMRCPFTTRRRPDASKLLKSNMHLIRKGVMALAATLVGAFGFPPEGGSYARAQEAPVIRTMLSAQTGGPGDIVRLDVMCGCDATDTSAAIFGRPVHLTRIGDRWQGLIGIDLDVRPGTYPIDVAVTPAGSAAIASTQKLTVIDRKYPVRRLRVAPNFVDPPASELARIQQDAAALQAIFEAAVSPRQWQGAFQAPVSDPPNSSFGARSVYNGQARSPHSGTDFSAKAGTPVTAPASGTVALARPLYFTGNTVVLDHGLGLYSVLAHLQELGVKEGDRITRGQVVGLVGGTGRVTAPHLHWSVRLNNARVDPLSVLAVTKDLTQ
jgi:murein DD-endopeptidase MepM/ murein hydrolase activator NlpD